MRAVYNCLLTFGHSSIVHDFTLSKYKSFCSNFDFIVILILITAVCVKIRMNITVFSWSYLNCATDKIL